MFSSVNKRKTCEQTSIRREGQLFSSKEQVIERGKQTFHSGFFLARQGGEPLGEEINLAAHHSLNQSTTSFGELLSC
jgi:hypothetical protein